MYYFSFGLITLYWHNTLPSLTKVLSSPTVTVCTTVWHNNTGHKAFLGFFYLDYAYNNPVMHVFIKVLKESYPGILKESVVNGGKDKSFEMGALQKNGEF